MQAMCLPLEDGTFRVCADAGTGIARCCRAWPRPVCICSYSQASRRPTDNTIGMWRIWFVIRKLSTGEYRLYSRKTDPKTGKRRNLGTFKTREEAERHEREIQFFKRRG